MAAKVDVGLGTSTKLEKWIRFARCELEWRVCMSGVESSMSADKWSRCSWQMLTQGW